MADKKITDERIPQYLTGQLTDKEKHRVDQMIEDDPEFEKEFAEFRQIKESLDDLSKDMPSPPADAFSRIMDNIDAFEAEEAKVSEEQVSAEQAEPEKTDHSQVQPPLDFFAGLIERMRSWLSVPQAGWGVAALQMAVILIMVISMTTGPEETTYQTLTGQAVITTEGASMNVVFQDTATEKEIRELLTSVSAKIVDGPGASGLYVLAIDDPKNITAVMGTLEAANIVKFIQKRM